MRFYTFISIYKEETEDESHYGVVSDGSTDTIGYTKRGGHVFDLCDDHGTPPTPFSGDMSEIATYPLLDINKLDIS